MGDSLRMTIPTQLVLQVLLSEPDQERYGLEITAATGLRSGTVHPILARLESLGWLSSQWEDVDPRREGRPARRYYLLTASGRARASQHLARAEASAARFRPLRPVGQH
jgi:PadR family transcriptional regulator, regulatory protein PadR